MDDLTLAVCPHDTVRNSEGWFRLVQYLSSRLGSQLHFQIALDFADFHSTYTTADLVYANPSDALQLIDLHGYTPLLRPADTYDEAVVVAGQDSPAIDLAALHGATVATVKGMLPTKLALRMLASKGVIPSALLGCESWQSVVSSVWSGRAPFGILYRDAYDDLSSLSKGLVRVIAATQEQVAFHMLCCGPKATPRFADLAAALLTMASDPPGQDVLTDMRLSGWQPVTDEALEVVRRIRG